MEQIDRQRSKALEQRLKQQWEEQEDDWNRIFVLFFARYLYISKHRMNNKNKDL